MKEYKFGVWNYIKVICGTEKETKQHLEMFDKEYSDFQVNMFLSNSPKFIGFIELLSNTNIKLTKEVHYRCLKLYKQLKYPKERIYFKYDSKKDKIPEDIELIMDAYNVNKDIAIEYFKVISDKEMVKLKTNDDNKKIRKGKKNV